MEEKLGLNGSALKAGGFVIWTGRVKDHPAIVVAGQDGFSTLYGVYDLVERLGVTFRLTGDIVPQQRDSFSIPRLNVRKEPAFPRAALGFTLVRQWIQNIVNFHEGKSYLRHVPFERLYLPGA